MFTKNVISKPINVDFDLSLNTYTTNIIQWLKPVIDLTGFHVYPTNGITEGLTFWMSQEKRSIYKDEGDYEWVDSTDKKEIYYVTCPSSKDGNFREIPTDCPVALDIAYVGTTPIQKIPISDNIEYVFYSLSKPFGLNTIRTGWLFTKKPNYKLRQLTRAKYYNHFAHSIAEDVIEKFAIDYVYNKYCSEQNRICMHYELRPSDCVWLGTSSDTKYTDFQRKKNAKARLCLTGLYNDL